jgi:hypothetical protein
MQNTSELRSHRMKDKLILVSDRTLAQQLSERLDATITVGAIARWRRSGRIPYHKLGYRTLRYDVQKVLDALSKREVKAKGVPSWARE